MNLHAIFSTQERTKILQKILHETEPIKVNALASTLKMSKGFISKYLDILRKERILTRTQRDYALHDTLMVRSLKILCALDQIDTTIFKKYSFVNAAGIYGSCVRGENTKESDVDIWIKIQQTNASDIAHVHAMIIKKIPNAKILFLTNEKIIKLKIEDPLFYYALHFGSITIYGEHHAI